MNQSKSELSIDAMHDLERLIVDGKLDECRKKLQEFNARTVGHEFRNKLAEFSIRAGMPLPALRFLHFKLNDEISKKIQEPEDIILYSRALYQLGETKEAIQRLSKLDHLKFSEVLFWMACANMFAWNYLAAEKLLKQYLKTNHATAYRKQVVQVNLAACLMNQNRFDEALELIQTEIENCKNQNFKLLLGNLYEIESQAYILSGRYEQAEISIAMAESLLTGQGALYELYVKKWKSILQFLRQKPTYDFSSLANLKNEALKLCHWSTVRECDFYEAILKEDQSLLLKLYNGTPSSHYRRRIENFSKRLLDVNANYTLHLAPEKLDQQVLENSSIKFAPEKEFLKTGKRHENVKLFSLFCALTEDFYQPSTLTTLFNRVYQDEVFNPFSSVSRVMRLLSRLNKWFAANSVPLQVRMKKSEFSLVAIKPIAILLPRAKSDSMETENRSSDLRKFLQNNTQSAKQIASHFGISQSSVNRLLKLEIVNGRIVKQGGGRSCVYRTNSNRKLRSAA